MRTKGPKEKAADGERGREGGRVAARTEGRKMRDEGYLVMQRGTDESQGL